MSKDPEFEIEGDCGGDPCVFPLAALVYTSSDGRGTWMRLYSGPGDWPDIGPFKNRINSIRTSKGWRLIYYPLPNFQGNPKDIQQGQLIPHFTDPIGSVKFQAV